MNTTSKSKSKKTDKSPKTKLSSSDSTTKGSASDSSHGANSPVSRAVSLSAASSTQQSPSQQQQQQKKTEQSSTDSQGGATVSMSLTMPQASPAPVAAAALLSPSAAKPSPTLWFTTEIQQMMHGFGDCRKPLAESASLVEEIVNQQMMRLLYSAEDIGRMRNARFVGIEDFLFLLRKDKTKLRRLMRYMTLKDVKSHIIKTSQDDEENIEQAGEGKQPMKKRQKICYEFLSTIDHTVSRAVLWIQHHSTSAATAVSIEILLWTFCELVALLDDEQTDEIKHERALRAELQTRTMDSQQYIEYCEARQASFTPRYKMQKFKDWLMAGVTLDIKPNPLAMEVLSYMAYETVSQIVDIALLVKQDQRAQTDNPFTQTTPAVCINHDVPPSSHTTEGQLSSTSTAAAAGLKSPPPSSGKLSSPNSSPPATPTTPGSLSSSSASLTQSSSSLGGSFSKTKSKKKKKSSSSSSRDVLTSRAITPSDIREAMRRYGQCIGPFADFSKCPLLSPSERLLCC